MGIYEKAVKKIETIEKEHAEKISNLKTEISRLNETIADAEGQRLEALKTENQKLYSASIFALDQARTTLEAKEQELNAAETGPIITKETAEALEAELLAGMKEKETQTETKFNKMIDEFYPEICETDEVINTGNELLKKIELEMLKDAEKLRLYKRTGFPINVAKYQGNLPCRGHAQRIMNSDSYRENGGETPIGNLPNMFAR